MNRSRRNRKGARREPARPLGRDRAPEHDRETREAPEDRPAPRHRSLRDRRSRGSRPRTRRGTPGAGPTGIPTAPDAAAAEQLPLPAPAPDRSASPSRPRIHAPRDARHAPAAPHEQGCRRQAGGNHGQGCRPEAGESPARASRRATGETRVPECRREASDRPAQASGTRRHQSQSRPRSRSRNLRTQAHGPPAPLAGQHSAVPEREEPAPVRAPSPAHRGSRRPEPPRSPPGPNRFHLNCLRRTPVRERARVDCGVPRPASAPHSRGVGPAAGGRSGARSRRTERT